ncbi:flagellar basal body P-ring protein FlgI [Larsenimonas rhizosphaerae]|uniref:Flagellar P-ring protein n=1 Tax=Larsenimonas rhizosphaerae TaxID=2944682 RepID=A0AA41ZE13_9GAMM|nr:flagellar basal body P-ring protein FlgI [Larsenimonas rhizosphaerae]MCM2130402.1 flagellar basal body P-ring protein FlgI [Larsenimonas rhizosphaerae]MCX2523107.1 flagellar basal body P-ring protein FlgI [Larsenimonas rhizosphaerae]
MTTLNRWLSVLMSALLLTCSGAASAAPLKDIATIAGVRENPIIGYGLVVGLDNSGDQTTQAPFTGQALRNMLSQLGITVPTGSNMQLKNVAAVMVTAKLPPFASPGQAVDVVVSSVGNAKSLRGGTLLMTPLKGADGQVYALAQGNVLIGGAGASAGGSSIAVNQLSAGRVVDGAIIERSVPLDLATDGRMTLELKDADFNTALDTMNSINRSFGRPIARALNSRTIELRAPIEKSAQVAFLAQIQRVDVGTGAPSPKVVINQRTGSVVMNGTVTLSQAAVAHGNLSVVIDNNPIVSQPNALAGGNTAVVPNADVSLQEGDGSLQVINASARLSDVVNALNALGATPTDLMSILQALKTSGALHAELDVI